ncbi:3-isopropylmalate dehydratase [Edwardsiella piscicida]|uniref:LeuD/DmdB family oxidoreductase small subunit n=1 Tax=Edwardsiella piscicida TaxID=1263550 RepID=UPI00084C2E4E|nr:3-isopropylmalate dehydratase [Edwardsiella piscicida]AOP43226.1 3-isopropylmalate dehydratase [Edwardsiella piscicida]EKS7765814.1 3-isopropylmalate dehydratase [Edwardsiella piscicida]UCQ29848.1 3-isopropylmalate dehydratase [Edwardsiella piscicida]UCQ56124.1 3-isopropylmalate dehydratase [Edwardsiella piscicida]
MDTRLHGNVWKFGNNINTDIISPPQHMALSIAEAAPYCLAAVNPYFAEQVRPGDILVAGNNLGSGSSRETSPLTLKYLGIQAVVARSFARIFYRNCINLGIPALSAPRASEIRQGDALSIDIAQGFILNITQQEIYPCTRLPDHIMAMIRAGGLVNYLRQTGGCDAN